MRRKAIKDLDWKTAPDTLTPELLARILGIGKQKAREFFKDKTFPSMDGLTADKEAVHLWWQGIYRKNEKDTTIGMLLIEQRKTNRLLEQLISEKLEEVSGY